MFGFVLQAQSSTDRLLLSADGQTVPSQSNPQRTDPRSGRIYGTVTDSAGNVVAGGHVTLENGGSNIQQTQLTNGTGSFNFTGLQAGSYRVMVTAEGFAASTGISVALASGEYFAVPQIELQIASATTSVRVVYSQHELAEQQVKMEEKQRVLGIVPNFYTSYVWDAEPLTSRQKFRLAWRTSIDPITFLGTGVIAGIQQWQNDFSEYGQGAEGYAKRYGAAYTDGFTGIMLGGAVLPSILHQDPRYFYKGTGTIKSRIFYAISMVVICKGDNGRWQPNYSNVLGTFAAAGISNAYYPSNDRGAALTVENSLLGLATGGIDALLQEFLIKKISRGIPPNPGTQH